MNFKHFYLRNSMKLFLIFLALVCYCSYIKIVNADNISEGGATSTTKVVRGHMTKSISEMFVAKAITGTSSYVYNQSGSSTINDGWIDCSGYQNKSFALAVPTYSSGSLTARVEILAGSSTINTESVSVTFTAITTVGYAVSISERASKIRVGWVVSSPTGSGSVHTSGYFED